MCAREKRKGKEGNSTQFSSRTTQNVRINVRRKRQSGSQNTHFAMQHEMRVKIADYFKGACSQNARKHITK